MISRVYNLLCITSGLLLPAKRLTEIITKYEDVEFWIARSLIERFSNDCRKTKTKAITPTNHTRSRQRDEPITIPNNYL